ncbi:MAG: kelch repeat-containing protein, partial [Planctomycetota bacterium]
VDHLVGRVRAAQDQEAPVVEQGRGVHRARRGEPGADGKSAAVIGGLETTAVTTTVVQSVELYNPATQSFDFFPNGLAAPRTVHTATLLDDGRFLVLGGTNAADQVVNTGEIFDPATGTSTPIAPMSTQRTQHTATKLNDGRVLIVGGVSNFDLNDPLSALGSAIASSEIYNPTTNSWSSGPNLPDPTFGHTATLLPSGNVLIAGGVRVASLFGVPVPSISDTCRRYVAGSNSYSNVPNIPGPRVYHGAAALNDGRALVFGGADGNLITLTFTALSSSFTYSEGSNSWTPVGSLGVARGYVEAATTASGSVLAAGGLATVDVASGTGLPAVTIERFDPSTGQWTPAATQLSVRNIPRAVAVDNGQRLLIVGGADQVGTSSLSPAAELFID